MLNSDSINEPLFLHDWWMDAVCVGKHWQRVEGMPCLLRQRWGTRFIVMPQQTQIGGTAWTSDNPEAIRRKATEIAHALHKLRLDYYYQHFPIGSPLPEALVPHGFTIRRHTTYRLNDLSRLDDLRSRFSENKRRQLRKAANLQLLTLSPGTHPANGQGISPEQFYAFHTDCLRRQGKRIAYTWTFFHSLFTACVQHNACTILALRDGQGDLHAAVFLVYDADTCYFLIPCYDPRHAKSGAGARIVDEAIRFAASHSRAFDFEGSMIPGVANHYAQFGSTPAYFYEVERFYNPLFRCLMSAYQWINRKKR